MEIEGCQSQFTGIIEGMGGLLLYRQRLQRLRLKELCHEIQPN